MLPFEIKEGERTNEESTHHFIYFPHAFDLIRCVFSCDLWGKILKLLLNAFTLTCTLAFTVARAHRHTRSYHTSSYVLINLSIKSIKFHSHIDITDTEIHRDSQHPQHAINFTSLCERARACMCTLYSSSSTLKYNKLHNSTL